MKVNTTHVMCPFTIIIDSREQSAFDFRQLTEKGKPLVVGTERKGLKTGDYSVKGFEEMFAVERKELGDLFNCMGSDRERFERQLERLNKLQGAWVMIEGGWDRILRGHAHSKMNPKSVVGSILAYQADYFPNVHWITAPGKWVAEQLTFNILRRCVKKYGEKEKDTGKG